MSDWFLKSMNHKLEFFDFSIRLLKVWMQNVKIKTVQTEFTNQFTAFISSEYKTPAMEWLKYHSSAQLAIIRKYNLIPLSISKLNWEELCETWSRWKRQTCRPRKRAPADTVIEYRGGRDKLENEGAESWRMRRRVRYLSIAAMTLKLSVKLNYASGRKARVVSWCGRSTIKAYTSA